jgi:hypothetical protein
MKKEICKGCKAIGCLFIIKECEELCSCVECLVKVVCQDWCDERLKDLKLISNDDRTTVSTIIDGNKCEFSYGPKVAWPVF